MTSSVLNAQVRLQNGIEDAKQGLKAKALEERGEIGSQLILMAILVGAAVAATTVLRPAISGLVSRIGGSIDGADAGG